MVYAQPSICPSKWHALTPMGLWHTHGSPNLSQKTRTNNNQQQKNEKLQNYGLCSPGWPQNKTERMWKERPCSGIEKTKEHEGDNYTNRNWCFWYSNKRIIRGTGGIEGWKTSEDHPNNCIMKCQNSENSPGYLRRLTVTQTSVKNYQLKLMWKTLNE